MVLSKIADHAKLLYSCSYNSNYRDVSQCMVNDNTLIIYVLYVDKKITKEKVYRNLRIYKVIHN